MSGIIKTIKAKDEHDVQHNIFPKTVLEAVVDSETNETLDNIIDELNNKIDNIEITGESPVENLLVYPYAISNETTDNYTIVDNKDGTLTISCNFPELSAANVQIVSEQPISAGTYTVSGCSENFTDSTVNINVYVDDTSGNRIHYGSVNYGQNFTFTVTELCYLSLNLSFNLGASLSDAVLKPMLELGTVAHDYKPYKDVSVLPKTGGTIDGDLTVKGALSVPMLADNTGDTLKSIPIAGGIETEETSILSDTLPDIKSYMGSFYGKSADNSSSSGWHNVMSVRHRNGAGDGNNYGIYLRSEMTTESANIAWNRQVRGTWQGERVILDTDNYSNYNVYPYGTCASNASSIKWGTAGYVVLAKITVTGTWCSGEYVEFKINSIGKNDGYVRIALSNTGTVSATRVLSASRYNTVPMFYVLTQNSNNVVIELIGNKQAHQNFTITDVKLSQFLRSKLSISYPNTFETSLRSEAVGIQEENPWTTVITSTTNSISFTLKPGYGYLIFAYQTGTNPMSCTAIIRSAHGGAGWTFNAIGVGGSIEQSISGTTFTLTFANTNGGCVLKCIEIG